MDYRVLAQHYEECLQRHGASAKGMDWPSEESLNVRFQVMADLLQYFKPGSLLDVGCGAGLFYDFVKQYEPAQGWQYRGLDISEKMIAAAHQRWDESLFWQQDILQQPLADNSVDVCVMNGVLTEKLSLSYDDMMQFAKAMISACFKASRQGVAFNVMSNQVDWCRPDLFHVSCDELGFWLRKNISPHFIMRQDYGLYEYTVYVYKEANHG
ncbi:bifunctional 2-polyprenyl-6-hydroxyphenol methylase/3-demethylubiquinol 3-O-methyltransferase UbiG [Pleionea sp. CnH1-48]|uniref:class I SAM-dependent methyltransferase n=1 Tax=Pleionea sp. CnH1-48 TaxID=2954494 RepID=UPI00209807DD|nr:class I SAM-dependent methyltransferase [Pleionea sp. CnH1-48]MCO7226134.1 class I SAM-dependent methyltransferase [Pleionea sp. CnH1-48]